MSIAIVFNNKDPKPWREALQSKLSNTKVEVYPNIEDKSKIDFALCWKPDKNVLSEFSSLQVIQSVGASVEHITNTQQLTDKMQFCRMVDEQLTIDMFEFLLASVMVQLKGFTEYHTQQTNQEWKPKSYRSIATTTIAILGLGKIGGFVAQQFAKMGFQVKGWSNSEKQLDQVMSFYGKDQFEQVLKETDFLINILPSTPATFQVLNAHHLSALKKGAYLINVGRGEHLIEEDLLQLLSEGHLSGVLLDVFKEEPLPVIHPFWKHPKITITPHIAAITNIETASNVIVKNYHKFQNGQLLDYLVDVKKGY